MMNNSTAVRQAAHQPLLQNFQQLPNPEITIPVLNVKVRPIEVLASLIAPSLEQCAGLAVAGAVLTLSGAAMVPASIATPCVMAGAAMSLYGIAHFSRHQIRQFNDEMNRDIQAHNAERQKEQELRQGSFEISQFNLDDELPSARNVELRRWMSNAGCQYHMNGDGSVSLLYFPRFALGKASTAGFEMTQVSLGNGTSLSVPAELIRPKI